jgi:hypothetical protein
LLPGGCRRTWISPKNGGALVGPSQQKKSPARNFEVRPTTLERGTLYYLRFKILAAVDFFLQLWPFVLFKKYRKYVKWQVNLKIHTTLKHIANKINCTCTIFWIRRMVKVAEKSQWRQVFWQLL